MHDETDTLKELHCVYCGMSGQAIAFRMEHIYWWNAWRTRGWSIDDLRFLIRYLRGKIRIGERNQGCLKFTNLVKDLDHFEEDLAMARSEQRSNERKPVRTARTDILEATGRTEANATEVVQVGNANWVAEWEKMKAGLK